ncbi:MAG: ral secretion pathway protein [Patescibacteria group bacterium]|jgi:prepilin-type N-terminal cleavage/methylation domain-containing protein|nr:ral secretion pathway protein [Patescibacteria group bacterium]
MKYNKFVSKKGFTILELLIVVAIIGLLSAVVLAALNSSRSKGRDAKRIEEIRQIINAVELSYNATGKYPSRVQYISTDKTKNPLSPYLWPIPKDPKTNAQYNYTGIRTLGPNTPCKGYHIGVSLENNNKVLEADSDFVSSTTFCRANVEGAIPAYTSTNNVGFNGVDTPTGNNKFKYDIRR